MTSLAAVPLWAQQSGLTGTVTDPSGAVIAGATVNLTHKGTGTTRNATTTEIGTYVFSQLQPGQYRLEITMQGFRTFVRDPVTLPVGITTTANATLEVGAVTEVVTVEEGAATVNTVDASRGIPISGTQVLNLPSQDLDPAGLLSLQAGVTFVASAPDNPGGYSGVSDFDGRGGAVNGARSDQTNITLDGVDVNDPENGYAFTSALRATQASLQEFRVTTSNYNSDLGRSSAAQVQLVTKSGTNDIHGMAYWTHRNEALGANSFFNNAADIDKEKLRRHIYGAAAGGPIVPDRLFIFGNFERMEEALESSALRDVPSPSLRDGVLIYECVDTTVCPGNSAMGVSGASYSADPGFYAMSPVEVAGIDPLGLGPNTNIISYLNQYPNPNTTIGTFDKFNITGFRFNTPIENDFKTYILKLDFNLTESGTHSVFARGSLQDDSTVSAAPYFPGNPANQVLLGNSRGLALGYKAVFGPAVVNNFRYGYTRIGEKFSGQRNSEYVDLRFIDELNGFDGTASTRTRQLPQHHFRDDVSIVRGNHTLSTGLEFRFTRNNRSNNANSFHQFSTNPSWVENTSEALQPGSLFCTQPGCNTVPAVAASGAAAYRDVVTNLLGLITQVNGNYNFLRDGSAQASGDPVRRRFAVDEYEFYFQDQWRVTPTLTVTGGLRYFVSSPPWETNGNQVAPTPNLGEWFELRRQLMLEGRPTNDAGQISFALGGKANNAAEYYAWDKNNWSPRVAVAWAPRSLGWLSGNGKLVIRGGYSLVYDRLGNGLASSFDQNGSFGMSTGLTSRFGACDEGQDPTKPDCPRFQNSTGTSAASALLLPPPPPAGFPATPPGGDANGFFEPGAFAITQALDSSITTPYSHVINVSVARELPGDIVVEGAYVGRRGRNLLIARDMAMPADICDPGSGLCYFEAAQQLVGMLEVGVDINNVAPIPFWENFFAGFGPAGAWGGAAICGVVPGVDFNATYSATQVAYDWLNCLHPDTTVFPFLIDANEGGFPSWLNCSSGTDLDGDPFPDCPFAMFDDQFATLNAWSSIARSEYHAFQFTVRRRLSRGIGFAMNYTFSHSLDHSSTPERAPVSFGFFTGGYTGSTINAWELEKEYASSDFDMRHQFNGNWYVELPFGRNKPLGADIPGWADQIIGGWQLSGILRANSGLPANVINARIWPTNWNLQGNATCTGGPVADFEHSVVFGPCPATSNTHSAVDDSGNDRGPNLFSNPDTAFESFRFTLPGDRGERNVLRADKYFNLDFAIAKVFHMPWEGHAFKFRWEVFNLTNSVYFDAVSLSASLGRKGTFGDYSGVMGGSRRMQVSLRYDF